MVSIHCTEQRDYYREKYYGHMQNMCVPIILLFVSTKYSFMHLILVRETRAKQFEVCSSISYIIFSLSAHKQYEILAEQGSTDNLRYRYNIELVCVRKRLS